MQATSSTQFAAAEAGTVPPFETVRENVWAVPLAMPVGHIPYSLLYLIRDSTGQLHVIDPGWDSDENWDTLLGALAAIGGVVSDIRSITATHLHTDHLGMADRMRAATGAPFLMHSVERAALASEQQWHWPTASAEAVLDGWGVPEGRRHELLFPDRLPLAAPAADRELVDGQLLEVPGFEIRVMSTPGHTPGHICLRDDTNGLLYTGDHLLPTMHAGIGLGGPSVANPLADYVASLHRVIECGGYEALPGHGYRFTGIDGRARQSAEHHLRRAREVAAVLDRGRGVPVWQIAEQLTWTAGWEQLEGFFLYSALAQTEMHRDYVDAGHPLDF